MASKNFPRKINKDRYKKIVDKNCLLFTNPIGHLNLIDEMKQYCLVNFGEQRGSHPLNEAINGWASSIEGNWASSWFSKYGGYIFWFKNTEDKLQFNLTFWNE